MSDYGHLNALELSTCAPLLVALRRDGYDVQIYRARRGKRMVGYRWWLERAGLTITKGFTNVKSRQAAVRAAYSAVYGEK